MGSGFKLLFWPRGRISRKEIWLLYTLPLIGFLMGMIVIVISLFGPYSAGYLVGQFGLVFLVFWSWPMLAVNIKRFHDIGRPGWNVLLLYLMSFFGGFAALVTFALDRNSYYAVSADISGQVSPTLGSTPVNWVPLILLVISLTSFTIWTVLSLGFRGQSGPNKYGPDPRNRHQETVDTFA